MSRDAAKRSLYAGHRSWWKLSHSPAVDRALNNAHFAERGLVSVEQQWLKRRAKHVTAPVQLRLAWDSCGQ